MGPVGHAEAVGDILPHFCVPKALRETLPKLETDAWLKKIRNKIISINCTQSLQGFSYSH